MLTETRTTDAKGRVVLPKSFANATVVIEQVAETEVRVRLARMIPLDEIRFAEESTQPLSERDRDRFMALLDNPPQPAAAFRRAVERQADRD